VHRVRGSSREAAVLLGALVPDLPRPVHLVAQAPQLDLERVLASVTDPQIRDSGPTGVVRVLHELEGLRDAPGPEVDGQQRLAAVQLGQESDELCEPEPVGLDGPPGRVESAWTILDRPDAVLPVEPRHKVSSGIADHRHPELTDQGEDVRPQTTRIRVRVPRLVDAGVDASAQVLNEGSKQARIDHTDVESRVEDEAGSQRHVNPSWVSMIDDCRERANAGGRRRALIPVPHLA
jgi:hypothetical protein